MQASHSRIDTHRNCPYQYYIKYVLGLKAKFDFKPDNALVLGIAMHLGIDEGVEAAIKNYFSNYNSVTPAMIDEAIKLEYLIPKVQEAIPPNGIFEDKIDDEDFIGYIDYLVEVPNEEVTVKGKTYTPTSYKTYDLYDFKYSNNKSAYLKDEQLHLYKYFFEKTRRDKIRNLYYVFIPKIKVKDYNDKHYRDKLIAELKKAKPDIVQITYDINHIIKFLIDTKHCIEDETFNKGTNCYFCSFKKYCESNGEDTSEIKKEEN